MVYRTQGKKQNRIHQEYIELNVIIVTQSM